MVVCPIKLVERNRQCLGTSLAVLNVLLGILGFVLICFGIDFHLRIQWKVYLIEGYNSQSMFIMILVVGAVTCLLSFFGAKMCYECGHGEAESFFDNFLSIWLVLILLVAILQLAAAIACFCHIASAYAGFQTGLLRNIKNYMTSHHLKAELDRLQLQDECCGAASFHDWMTTDWVPAEFNPLRENLALKESYMEFYENAPALDPHQLLVTPFSCCDLKHKSPCFHDFINQPTLAQRATSVEKTLWWDGVGLFRKGCAGIIMKSYNKYLRNCGYLCLALLGFQLLISIMTRYLQTSLDNLELYGKADNSVSPGWLCEGSICPCL